ncbi:MAG: hypothetical protein JWR00_1108 [Rubritepida sp.]|nr:hypothetical protein [Rubritepida sp.]
MGLSSHITDREVKHRVEGTGRAHRPQPACEMLATTSTLRAETIFG